jgi:hypothetical protein
MTGDCEYLQTNFLWQWFSDVCDSQVGIEASFPMVGKHSSHVIMPFKV